MRKLMMVMAVCLAWYSEAPGQPAGKPEKKFPITLTLKDKVGEPMNPRKSFPEITYTKLPDGTAADAAWVVEIELVEDGKVKTHSITVFDEKNPKEALIRIPGQDGTFTGKDGKLETMVMRYLAVFDVRGTGTLRFALADSKDFITKQKTGKAINARKLSNWLEIPIQIDGPAGLEAQIQEAVKGGKKGRKDPLNNAQNNQVVPGELLQFVCAKDEAWRMGQISLFEEVYNPRKKTTRSAAVTEAQQAELNTRIKSNDPWASKLLLAIEHTNLYLRITCREQDQLLITDVLDKFGEPDRKQNVYAERATSLEAAWHYYGMIRLGVSKQGRIFSVQVDSPHWRSLCEEIDVDAAAAVQKKTALKPKPAKKDVDPEVTAAIQLRLAKTLQKSSPAAAKLRLEQIVKDWPNTEAAKEAKLLFDEQ